MEKFVKVISTNEYKEISQAEFDVDPTLYVDRTDRPVYILNHYSNAGVSYWRARRHAVLLADVATNGITDFNDEDKDALGAFAYGDQIDEMKTFYETYHGISSVEADGLFLKRAAANRSNMAKDAKEIVASPKIMEIGIKYLTVLTSGEIDSSQAFDFTGAISGYLDDYERFAVLGTAYGDEHEGCMDYYESTGIHAGGGLLIYTLNPSVVALMPGPTEPEKEAQARGLMIGELKDLQVEGNL